MNINEKIKHKVFFIYIYYLQPNWYSKTNIFELYAMKTNLFFHNTPAKFYSSGPRNYFST